mmetsp:Transcript_82728/g.242704  ORF Transcript_82728/g.242704 Transcript_82728/m.242704 type:complete len:283 (+) Transcript_82728:113-961(+)
MRREPDVAASKGSSNLRPQAAEIRRRLFEEVEQQVKLQREREQEAAARGMPKPASIAYIALENRSLTPSQKLRDASRFHQPASPRRSPTTPREAAYESREACRFHREQGPQSAREGLSSSVRSLPSDQLRERAAAGKSSARERRRDLPPDTPGSRGRARSLTPEYHNRYRRNTLGTSLPGASLQAASHAGTCLAREPPALGQRKAAPFDPRENQLTASYKSQVACRFHTAAEAPQTTPRVERKPFTFSSTEAKPTAALAGSLRGSGSLVRPRRAELLRTALF